MEILTGLEVNMQFCCPEEWKYSHYEGQQNYIFTENGPVKFPLLYFVY